LEKWKIFVVLKKNTLIASTTHLQSDAILTEQWRQKITVVSEAMLKAVTGIEDLIP